MFCCTFQERIVVENDHWVCLVPYWAVWPYETMLLPRRHVLRLEDLSSEEKNSQSYFHCHVLSFVCVEWDNLRWEQTLPMQQ